MRFKQRLHRTWITGALFSGVLLAISGCGGGGSSEPAPPPPTPPTPPTSISYSISVSASPSASVASVGDSAEASITWSFSANPSSSVATNYSVSSSTSGVQISGGSGSVAPGTSISTQLSYSCTTGGTVDALLTLTVGDASTEVTWSISCTEEQISVQPLPDTRVVRNDAALATLEWQFETTGDASEALNYVVSSDSQRVQITNSSGSATAGSEIQNGLRYSCSDVGVHRLALSIRVGSATTQVSWLVTCTIEDVEVITVSFHQGPLVEQVKFSLVVNEWQTQLEPLFYADEERLRLSTNRQTFVTVSLETPEESEIDFDLIAPNPVVPIEIEEVRTTNLLPSVTGSRPHYTRQAVFNVESEDLLRVGSLHFIIDPEDTVPQNNEQNNEIVFNLNEFESVQMPPFNLVVIPIVSNIGTPDLSDIQPYTDATYELLPIATQNVRIHAEVDVTDQDGFDPNKTLDTLWDLWLDEADRDEFYHGIFAQTGNVTVCGLAYVGANVGITGEIGPFCSENTIAHEIGHNLSLNHAPACGAEDANPDPSFPYMDGTIGSESGWYMRKERHVGNTGITGTRVYDLMSYCIETFTSQYSYGKAGDYFLRRIRPIVSSAKPPKQVVAGFDVLEGRSLVISGRVSQAGEWSVVRSIRVARKPMQPGANGEFELELVHGPSGTVLHTEKVQLFSVDHGGQGIKTWGARIPEFSSESVFIQIQDSTGRVQIQHDLGDLQN